MLNALLTRALKVFYIVEEL